MELNKDSINLILDIKQRYSAIVRLRDIIKNYYNKEHFNDVDILGVLCCSDEEHYELFLDVLECGRYEPEILNDLAQKILLRENSNNQVQKQFNSYQDEYR